MGHSSSSNDWWRKPFDQGLYPLDSIARDWKEKTETEIVSLRRILRLARGAKILDVGCGVGRHSIALEKEGFAVTGADFSRRYLALAKKRSRKVKFVRADMRVLPFEKEFDGAINLFSSFGYFKSPADDLKTLKSIFRALKPGGRFLIDNLNYEGFDKVFSPQCWSELGDGTLVLEQRTPPDKSRVLKSAWLFVRKDGKRSEMYSEIRAYDFSSLSRLFKKAGFTDVRQHAPLTGGKKPWRRLVVSATRPRNPNGREA